MKNIFFSLCTLVLFSTLVAQKTHASIDSSREQEARLATVVDLRTDYQVSAFERATAINALYQLAFESQLNNFFGPKALVQRVVIDKNFVTDANRVANRSALRDHTLFFSFDGSSTEWIKAHLAEESSVLASLEARTGALKAKYPLLKIERTTDMVWTSTTTNRRHLNLLNQVEAAFAGVSGDLARAHFTQVVLEDKPDVLTNSEVTIFEYKDRYDGHDEKILNVVAGTDFADILTTNWTSDTLSQMLELTLHRGLSGIAQGYLSDASQFSAAVAAAATTLDSNAIAALAKLGVTQVSINSGFNSQADLIQGRQLTLGLTVDDDRRILDLVLGR